MPAIETEYRGHLFRSRLEARWAAFFDGIGMAWTYEPFDADGYIPDFEIPGPVLIEVKPASTLSELQQHRTKLERGLRNLNRPIVIVGNNPLLRHEGMPVVGYFGTRSLSDRWTWGPHVWIRSTDGAVRWYPMYGSVRLPGGFELIDSRTMGRIEREWGEAHRRTRWEPGT